MAALAELFRPGADLSKALVKSVLAPTALTVAPAVIVLATVAGLIQHFADPLAARPLQLAKLAVCWPALALGEKPSRGSKASSDTRGGSVAALADELVQRMVCALLQSLSSGGEARCMELARAMGVGRLNSVDSRGRAAIHHAAARGLSGLCTALLKSADVCDAGAVDDDGSTALHLAADGGHREACEALLSLAPPGCFDVKDFGGQSALHVAAWKGHAEVCAALARHEHFGGTNARDKAGRTALHWAAFFGQADACRELLGASRFLEADAPTWKAARREMGEGCTALHLAALGGHAEACRALLEAPSFTAAAATDCSGLTAAELADEEGHTALAEALARAVGAHA